MTVKEPTSFNNFYYKNRLKDVESNGNMQLEGNLFVIKGFLN